MHFLTLFTIILLTAILGEDPAPAKPTIPTEPATPKEFTTPKTGTYNTPMKVMFFGDSVVSGVHNSEAEICPFRYDFLRVMKGKDIKIIGTNADKEGACQKIGEELSLENNGYQDAELDDLLDYITADLQYLSKPVDYIFTSIGLIDCLTWVEGRDFQILSQSTRRVMGRLLNLNDKARILHIPILLPPSAGKVAVACMEFVNKKLRDVYDPEKKGRISIIDPLGEVELTEELFVVVKGQDDQPIEAPVNTKVTPPAVVTPAVQAPVVVAPVPATPTVQVPAVTTPTVPLPAVVKPTTPVDAVKFPVAPVPPVVPNTVSQPTVVLPNDAPTGSIQSAAPKVPTVTEVQPVAPEILAPQGLPTVSTLAQPDVPSVSVKTTGFGQPVVNADGNSRRRKLKKISLYLPNKYLASMIANALAKSIDWNFRAQTPTPTMAVTQDPDYYGYEWCVKKYEENECFEYYYGYVWCLQEYSEDDCYSYYYGKVDKWDDQNSYTWCLNFYDEEYCSFAYKGEEPDTWDWLSFGYHDCLKVRENNECFELYYGYAWCVKEYNGTDCYEYYYGGEEWEWNRDSSYKWCLNFYTDADCLVRYPSTETDFTVVSQNTVPPSRWVGFVVAVIAAVLIWICYKKACSTSKEYTPLSRTGGEDEVEFL